MTTTTAAAVAAAQDERVARTAPIGMFAVARHMIDHHLPAPRMIEAPTSITPAIKVLLWPSDLDRWVDSVHVDATIDEPCSVRGKARRIVQGRLDNGVRIVICTIVPALVEPESALIEEPDEETVGILGPEALAVARAHAFGGQS